MRFSGLWRHPDFMKLWTGQAVSRFGSTITREALPLTALLVLGATPFQMGLLAAVASAPVLLVGLVAGMWVDRRRRRPLMIAADLTRALLLVSIPVAVLLGRLTIAQLFVEASLVSVLTVFFDVAFQSYVPVLVQRERIVEANQKLGLSGSLAEATAPGVAGALVQVVSAPLTILIDAGSFLVSALLLGLVRTPEAPPKPPDDQARVMSEIGVGLRFVLGHPVLRAFAARALVGTFFGYFFAALYGLYCIRDLGMSPALLGMTIVAGGIGDLIGALLSGPATRRFGIGPTITGTLVVGAAAGALIPLAGGPLAVATAMIVASQFVGDAALSVFEISALSVCQVATPDGLLGRVNGGMYLVSMGFGPLGAAVGGYLGGAIGVRETLVLAVVGSALGGFWLIASPVRTLWGLPAVSGPG